MTVTEGVEEDSAYKLIMILHLKPSHTGNQLAITLGRAGNQTQCLRGERASELLTFSTVAHTEKYSK